MVYIVCWLVHYLMIGLTLGKRVKIDHAFFVSLFLFSFVSIFRWNVGTDSANYNMLFEMFSWETLFHQPVEPLFVSLCLVIRYIVGTDRYTLNILSALFSVLLLMVFARSSDDQKKVLYYYLIPIFFFSYSMNIIRFGIAAVMFVYAWQGCAKSKTSVLKSAVFLFFSGLMHVSVMYMMSIYAVCFLRRFERRKICILIFTGFLLCILNSAHIKNRKDLYVSLESQTIAQSAGVARAGLALVLTAGMVYFLGPRAMPVGGVAVFNLVFILLVMLKNRIVGLRLLDIYMFAIPLLLIFYFHSIKTVVSRKVELFLVPFSFVMCVFVYKDMYNSKNHSKTPFLPYRTVFANER